MSKRRTLEDCHKLAAERGGRCLSVEYVDNHSPLRWRCDTCNHEWLATYANAQRGSWCPRCAKRIRYSIEDCHQIAAERGGHCLSEVYKNNKAPLEWRCAKGHVWWTRMVSIVARGQWCPVCSKGKKRQTCIERYGVPHPLQHPEFVRKNVLSQAKTYIIRYWKDGTEIICQGKWELKLAEIFNFVKLDFTAQVHIFTTDILLPSGGFSTYRPDFYLSDLDLFIEVKGRKREDAMIKWDWFRENNPRSELWDEKKFRQLKILSNRLSLGQKAEMVSAYLSEKYGIL